MTCCVPHLERTNEKVPAVKLGMCQPCLDGLPIRPEEEKGVSRIRCVVCGNSKSKLGYWSDLCVTCTEIIDQRKARRRAYIQAYELAEAV